MCRVHLPTVQWTAQTGLAYIGPPQKVDANEWQVRVRHVGRQARCRAYPMKYKIYGDELSLFTRKLECACLFYGLDFVQCEKNHENAAFIQQRAGTHQVPVLLTPENWMLSDTTPILALLDARHPGREMFPAGLYGAIVHVLEEYFDEWVSRVMVHFRWHYPARAQFAAAKMSHGEPELGEKLKDWGRRACRATGTEFPPQQRAAEVEYLELMAAADRQLHDTPFLLGARPTALDCCVLGGLRAHTLMDPDPKPRLSSFTTLLDWNAHWANERTPSSHYSPLETLTPFAEFVLSRMRDTYQPFIRANAAALASGDKLFDAYSYGSDVRYLCRPYPERSRQMVCARIAALPENERTTFDAMLAKYDLVTCFA